MPASQNKTWPARSLKPALVVAALAIISFLLTRSCPRLNQLTGSTMGTTYTVKYVVRSCPWSRAGPPDPLARDIQACLDDVNALMSTYRPDSELSRFNTHADGSPFAVSAGTLEVFQCAREVSDLTGGAFDVTVGPIVNAYGFGPGPDPARLPDDDEIARLRERVGYHRVEIDPASSTLRKQRPDVYCDLSAIAKGYGVDQVADVLDRCGIADYMVEIGGEVRTRGRNVKGLAWTIAIEKPTPDGRAIHRVIKLVDKSVATSGDYRNFYVKDGLRISHTIDPRTGRPVTHNLASVSVIHDQCMWADAWATALMVLGPTEGYALAESRGIAALLLIREDGDIIKAKATSAFAALAGSD